MNSYNKLSFEELVEAQENLSGIVGPIEGALGGLPVAERNSEFFAVFDEAGDTGPEIIGKTQFRVTYLVNSSLDTSKPSADSVAIANINQNFEKGSNVIVRADNATVLNQTLTDLQSLHDVGTLTLISTSEYGKNPEDYASMLTFKQVGIEEQESEGIPNVTFQARALGQVGVNGILPGNEDIVEWTTISEPPVGFSSYINWDNERFLMQENTVDIGTQIKFSATVPLQLSTLPANSTAIAIIELIKQNGSDTVILDTQTISWTSDNFQLSTPINKTAILTSNYNHYVINDQIKIRITYPGFSYPTYQPPRLKIAGGGGLFKILQKTPPEGGLAGITFKTKDYWDKIIETYGTPGEFGSYSIITTEQGFGQFYHGDYIQSLNKEQYEQVNGEIINQSSNNAILSFDPNQDGNTFDPVITPAKFLPGDKLRFEYDPTQVYTIFKVEDENNQIRLTIEPGVQPGIEVNHYVHYRVIPDGAYIIVDSKKNNEAGVYQPFQGIILPQFPSSNLLEKQDNLIFNLKQVGIIEN